MSRITTIAELEAIYGQPGKTSTVKEVTHITPHYRAFIAASPFALLATGGLRVSTARRAVTSPVSCGYTTSAP
jgi:hypothetical protein